MADWSPYLTNLRDVLADLYFNEAQARTVVADAGLQARFINFEGSSTERWHAILRDANNRHRVEDIVSVARRDYPENQWLAAASPDVLNAVRGSDIATTVAWAGPADPEQVEALMGPQSTLLPISFLQTGLKKAGAVAKVVLPNGSGSGFVAEGNLLITNHHVIDSVETARKASVLFNYQLTPEGRDADTDAYRLDPDAASGFATSVEDDWTAVRFAGDPAARWGTLSLMRRDPRPNDFISIIQHPGGGPKQIAMFHNTIAAVSQNRVQYLTDTLPGSSGSPAFDQSWDVVALHHSGGWLRDPGTKQAVYRNEGIHINAVIDGLANASMLPPIP
jgi:V8-like Glu-specific endopeptidase